jgi:RimJ/RimL family protein N-acetyltransferase
MSFEIPVIETERLILRGRRLEDFPAYAAMWAHPEVVRYIGGKPLTQEEAWVKFTRQAGFWALKGYGFWALEEKASGAFVGDAGAADFKRDLEPSLEGKPEFGWSLMPSAQGKGYATEAIKAGLEWAREALTATTYSCIIDSANAPSLRVAEKCGFRKVVETTYKGSPTLILEQPAA